LSTKRFVAESSIDARQRCRNGKVGVFVDAVIAMAQPVETHFLWRPQLRDPNDEMALEAAVNGQADILVTFNLRDFGRVPARFGVEALVPAEALSRIR
jgi:predicted nucleic acid-binding protein